MAARSNDDTRVKPGITVDKDVWEQFREKFKGEASQDIERYMRMRLESETDPNELLSISGENINHLSIAHPENWQMSITNSALNLKNVSVSYSANDNSDVGTDGTTQTFLSSSKDIIIE
jgi:hypothetical protein